MQGVTARSRMAASNSGVKSLRDRKKEQMREHILRAATQLFRDREFERTRIEDIAASAEVGVATVYNYFTTKQQILVEIVLQGTDDVQSKIASVVKSDHDNPVEAIADLMSADYGDISDADKALWRELLASMTRDQENRAAIESNRGRFREHLRDMIRGLIKRGMIKRDSDVNALVDICYAIYAYHFRQLVCLEAMTKAKAMQAIRRDLRTLLSGARTE